MIDVKYGDPFLVSVTEGHLDGVLRHADLMEVGSPAHEEEFLDGMRSDAEVNGATNHLYICIPIGRVAAKMPARAVDDGEDYTYDTEEEVAGGEIERMMRAAIAMGVSNEERHPNTR